MASGDSADLSQRDAPTEISTNERHANEPRHQRRACPICGRYAAHWHDQFGNYREGMPPK
jgi:hypothetical protein